MDPVAPPGPVPEPRPSTSPRGQAFDFSVGQVLGRSFRIFGRQSWVLIPLAAVFFTLPTWLKFRPIQSSYFLEASDSELVEPSYFVLFGGWPRVATMLAEWVLPLAFQAVVAYAVFQALRGTPARWGASIGQGLRRLPHAVGASLLIFLAMLLPMFLVIVMVLRGSMTSTEGMQFGVFLALAYMAFLGCRLYVGVQAAVVEGVGPVRALSRSAWLTRRARWRLFAILLVMYVVPYALNHGATRMILSAADGGSGGWTTQVERIHDLVVLHQVVETTLEVVFAALQAVTAAVTYHALRQAKEGVGLDELLAVFD